MTGKYHNRHTEVDGIVFHSAAESRRYVELKLLQKAGEITHLELQPRFEIIPAYKRYDENKRKVVRVPPTYMVADFSYKVIHKTPTGAVHIKHVVEDVKGVATAVYKIKRKLFEIRYSNQYEFREVAA